MAVARTAADPGVRHTAVEEDLVREEAVRIVEVAGPATAEGGHLPEDNPEGGSLEAVPVPDSPEEEVDPDNLEEGPADNAAAVDRKAAGTAPGELRVAAARTGLAEELQALRGVVVDTVQEEAAGIDLVEARRQEAADSSSLPEAAAAGRTAVDGSFVMVKG